LGGVHPAYDYVRQALEAGIPVVTANKSLMAEKGEELRAIARRAGVSLAYEAAVLAGVPFIGAWTRRPLMGSPLRITGILNGTSHFLTCALERGGSFESALTEAIDRGYAEPDSAADVSGRDAAEKLTILAHLSGCRDLKVSDLTTMGRRCAHARGLPRGARAGWCHQADCHGLIRTAKPRRLGGTGTRGRATRRRFLSRRP
jgi:homoserine dehydrogenase